MNRLQNLCTAFTLLISICAASVCVRRTTFSHVGLSGRVRIPVTIRYPCRHGRKLPAVLVLNGGLVRTAAYKALSIALARRGFIVYIASYTSRAPPAFPIIFQTECPKNGTFVSVSMVYSLSKFASRNPRVNVNTGVLFGHSYGSTVASSAIFDKQCGQDVFSEFFCDGATARKVLPLNIKVYAIFEGGANLPFKIPQHMMVVYMYSPFNIDPSTLIQNPGGFRGRLRSLVAGGRGNYVEVGYSNATNHFGPNDFEAQYNHSKTLCSAVRPLSQQSFKTTRQTQCYVIQSIASVISMSHYYFNVKGLRALPYLVNRIPALPYVRTADILADLDKTGKC